MRVHARAALAVLSLAVAMGPVSAVTTFDLYIHAYCPAGSNLCGFGTYGAWRAHILQAVAEAVGRAIRDRIV